MGENYNTGTCTIRVGRDYVCLNFGSNLAASASVRDRGTSDRVPGGRAFSVTVPNTNCMVNRLPRSFGAKVGSTSVRRDLPAASSEAAQIACVERFRFRLTAELFHGVGMLIATQ